ncbi:hypothetical protein V2J09_019035 [Rumex salicifolius]
MINGTKRRKFNRLELCRMPVLFELLCFLFLFSFEHNFSLCLGLNSEGSALLRFRERVAGDPFKALSSWNGGGYDADPCSWFGVQCSNGTVVAFCSPADFRLSGSDKLIICRNLEDLSLRGTLAPELGNLSHIKSIILRNNSFYGTVPKEILALMKLEVLDLGHNDFTGPVTFELVNNLSLVTLKIGKATDIVLQSRRLLQSPSPSKLDAKKVNKKVSASSQVPSPAPSPSRSQPSKPKAEDSSPKSPRSPAPSPSPSQKAHSPEHAKKTNSSSSPISSPSPSKKVHSPAPAPAPAKMNNTTSSPKKAPVGGPSVLSNSSPSPSSASTANGKATKSHGVVIWLSVVSGSLAVVLTVIAIFFCRSSKVVTVKPWATGLSGQLQRAFVSGVPKLKRAELETACEDFSNIIGTLTDSTVYKGTLSSGVEIAVVSSSVNSRKEWSRNLEMQFRKKVETLSKVNHKNFVNLIGYCEEEKPFTRMMVFEYAPNGTLFEHLHIKEAERLDWRMRLRIVMGLAYCLDHMHHLSPPIPHRVLQSSSVYLSEDYAAKVSDFSFWTEVTSGKMRSPSMQLLEASMADKDSNIHNFGVLLFEMITGRIPYSHDGSVEDWVWEYLRTDELPREIIDPTLTTSQEKEIPKLFEIIKDCMHPDPQQRPTMREVAIKLMEITGIEPDRATPRISPLWWAELEVMATET